MVSDVLYSSKKMDWETPQGLFDQLDDEFNFDLDAAANPQNAKCGRYFTESDNGLAQSWGGRTVWLNPPYGRQIGAWMEKAYTESLKGSTVVCLVPARTDTQWFHRFVYGKAEIRFLEGRVKFSGGRYIAPFPSMIVVYRGKADG